MTLLRRPAVLIGLGVAAVLAVVALSVFQPWKLFVDRTVDEALPTAAAPVSVAVPAEPVAAGPVAAGPVELARGELISHEHASSGSVVVLELPDGSRVLRLEDLDTSDGPLLKVWLTDAPVIEGRAGWHVFDDGEHVDLGELKGNIGSSNYPIPAGVDLAQLTSVSIWCDRFDVSFAAAALAPVA
ncbi:DM13 domain-containing protein [Pseudonocardia petroleophila]|uniref:DM13 domain-containing protein n=1 Tax=Pseudonocardia petroleophila TaxID=37331 RepID=A0A7G7MQW2_9PSEU|nr:DM13 domain-containing protein [Pseudonocardia petroleophila]QNG55173.1 DM13 domain-containing protein [Pseudonocardia petroleophila]